MKFFVFILIIVIFSCSNSGAIEEETVPDCFFEEVKNNLISYLIYYKIELNKGSIDIGRDNDLFENRKSPILNSCQKYDLSFKKSELIFIDTSYTLYSYSWSGCYWDPCEDSIQNIRFKNYGTRYHCFAAPLYRNLFNDRLLSTGLIAYKSGCEILFCNGVLFEDNIENNYFKDSFTEEKLIEYTKIRCFNFQPIDIEVDLESRTVVFYSESIQIKAKLTITDTKSEYYPYFYKIEKLE